MKIRAGKVEHICEPTDRLLKKLQPDKSWQKPSEPKAPVKCKCGGIIIRTFIEPIFYEGRVFAGTGVWVHDEKCQKCKEKEEAERLKAIQEQEYQSRIQRSGLYPKHLKMRFDNLIGEEDEATKFCKKFCVSQDFNLFLWGGSGIKKTHLLSAVANELLKQKDVHFWRTTDLLNNIRKTTVEYGSADADDWLKAEVESAAPILLDDIGAEKVTDFALEKFYNFFDFCDLYERKGIIIVSNLNLDTLAERLSDRITSRIAGLCKIKEVKGDDWRLKK